MAANLTPQEAGPAPSRKELETRFAGGAREARWWSNGPGDEYSVHQHGFHKVLYCQSGSIVFHVDGADIEMLPGDRLDIEPGTPHAATVGPGGVTCVEAGG